MCAALPHARPNADHGSGRVSFVVEQAVAARSALHKFVHDRFCELFGDPDSSLGRDDHWSLRPEGPYQSSINVLVNGTAEQPAIWIFESAFAKRWRVSRFGQE